MRARILLILLVWGCCVWLDTLGLCVPPTDPTMRYSFLGALIGAIGSVASGAIGAIAGNSRRKAAERAMRRRKKELEEWRDSEMGMNFLDRADARSLLRRVGEHNAEARKALETSAMKRGLTDEAKVMQAAKLNENYADAVSRIAAAGVRHKDEVQQRYLDETANLDGIKIQNLMDTSGIGNLVQGLTGAAAGLGTALASAPDGTTQVIRKAKAGKGDLPDYHDYQSMV